jgi:hypothetical protein
MHPVARVSTNTLIKTTVLQHVVHNKIEHKKYLLRTVVLIKVLVGKKSSGGPGGRWNGNIKTYLAEIDFDQGKYLRIASCSANYCV